MKCPVCNEGKLALFQDAIVGWAVYEHDGRPGVSPIKIGEDYLDETWLECTRCHETNQTNKELDNLYRRIE